MVIEEYYIFNAGSSMCATDTYLIQVVAVNPAGRSLPAEISAMELCTTTQYIPSDGLTRIFFEQRCSALGKNSVDCYARDIKEKLSFCSSKFFFFAEYQPMS